MEIVRQQLLYDFLCAPFLSFEIREKIRVGNVRLVGRVVVLIVEDAL